MDEQKTQEAILTLSKQFIVMGDQIAMLRAAVNVLRVVAATELAPDDVAGFLKQLQALEQNLVDSDPETLKRQQAAEITDSILAWKRRGSPPADS